MIGRVRQSAARRVLRAALAARRPRPLPALRERRLLVVLPDDVDGLLAAREFLDGVDLAERQVTLVHLGETPEGQPAAFEDRVREVGAGAHDWRRLPAAAVRRELWETNPDVALSLAAPDDLAAALLVGGSPAGLRIGRFDEATDGCFDLLVGGEPTAASSLRALDRLLRRLDPPVLPLR